MLQQLQIDVGQKKPLIIKDLPNLLLYVQSLNASSHNRSSYLFQNSNVFGFNDPRLIELHENHVCLYVDKYLETSIPDIQTEFLLESQGFSPCDYDGYLGKPDKDGVIRSRFRVNFCKNPNLQDYSEFITPLISGGRYNPYVRFNSSKISGATQLNKLQDLVGLDVVTSETEFSGTPIIDLMVFTFPFDFVGKYLLIPNKRNWVINKMWNCWREFFKQLRFLFNLPLEFIHGCNVSLHLWSSEFPLIPHPHFHVVFPHFSYLNVTKRYREDVEFVYDDLYEKLYSATDKADRYYLKKELSEKLNDFLYFTPLEKIGPELESGNKLPFDASLVRFIWSEIVNEEFKVPAGTSDYDVFIEFVKVTNKAKLLHYLQYKNRPVILDMDLFFKKVGNCITGYTPGDIHLDVVHSFVQSLFIEAAMKEDVQKCNRYESILKKIEFIASHVDAKDLFSWLQFLSIYRTDTRTYGFWQNIKRYRITSIMRGELPSNPVCPICGNDIEKTIGVNELFIDLVIVHDRSKFKIFTLDGG